MGRQSVSLSFLLIYGDAVIGESTVMQCLPISAVDKLEERS